MWRAVRIEEEVEFEVEDNGSSTGNTAKKVKVSWNANGGKVSGSSKVVKYKGTYGKLPSPKRAGYTFAGWYTSRTGGSKVAANTKVTKKKNHTLYARWKKTAVGNAAIGKLTNRQRKETEGADQEHQGCEEIPGIPCRGCQVQQGQEDRYLWKISQERLPS